MKLRPRSLAALTVLFVFTLLTGCVGLSGGSDRALTARP